MARSFSFKPLVWALAAAFGAAGAQAADDLSLGRTCLSCSPEKLGEEAAAKRHCRPTTPASAPMKWRGKPTLPCAPRAM
ncbi:MAG TPA: hypothetical protein PLK27_00700 [Neisseria sp.]|nr:hypothetical protein [Neisseria sp.]